MTPMGGSEILYLNLLKYVDDSWRQRVNLIMSNCDLRNIVKDRINIMWQHLNVNEENVFGMQDPAFIDSIDYMVFVSHWQFNRFKQVFQMPVYKSIVIKNAIEPIAYEPRTRTEKLRLIYTSTPWRGMDILLDAFELLNRTDIELDIYSSAKIYGDYFEKITSGTFDALFHRARNTPGVNFHEYQPNSVVRSALQQAHIFAYPSIFEETSCVSAIEAAAAGCKIVTTNLGALPETVSDWATIVPHGPHREILAMRFARELDRAIDGYWSGDNQQHLRLQSDHYNRYWSWQYRRNEWNDFLQTVMGG